MTSGTSRPYICIVFFISMHTNHFSSDLRSQFSLLEEVCMMADLSPLKRDLLTEFLSQPHSCKPMQSVDLSQRPMISSISHLLNEIHKRVETKEFRWYGSKQDDAPAVEASPFVVLAVSTQWSFGITKSSELLQNLVHCQ